MIASMGFNEYYIHYVCVCVSPVGSVNEQQTFARTTAQQKEMSF